jgi:O-antigen/teichoic acid export membrane protein
MAVGVAVSVGRRYGVRIRPGRPSTVHVRSSGLYATTISAIALQNDGDKVVLGAAKLGAEVGLYAAAYRLVSMGTVPLRALLGASHRRFLEHDPTVRNQHLRRAVTFACVGVGYGIVFGGALFLAAPLVTLLLGDEFRGAVVMLQVLAPVVAVRSVAEFGLNGLLGFGRVGVRTTVTIIAALTAMVLYLLLIPTMGWQGAVIGTYASELLLAGLAWTALIRFQLQHNAGLLPKGDVGTPGEPLPSAHGVPASDARGR